MAKKNAMPSVLAFEKKLVFSDGYMYGLSWAERDKSAGKPLGLQEKSVRGTISNRLKDKVAGDPAKLDAEIEKPNLQRVDACALGMDQDTLHLSFTLKVLSGVEKPSACNDQEFAQKYAETVRKYIDKTGFAELARRYAMNLANARFLWRNRFGVENLEVRIKASDSNGAGKDFVFDAKDFSLQDFDDAGNADIAALAKFIADALCGRTSYAFLRVDAYAQLGVGQEVYPSEELIFDKGRGDKSKVLYQVNGIAAMHSQKLGNAIRTIDTWYPAYADDEHGPIAIEPYGAVTNLGKAFRTPKEKVDFYTLFDNYAQGGTLAGEEQEDYVMAVLVRGGVFGQSSKEQ